MRLTHHIGKFRIDMTYWRLGYTPAGDWDMAAAVVLDFSLGVRSHGTVYNVRPTGVVMRTSKRLLCPIYDYYMPE